MNIQRDQHVCYRCSVIWCRMTPVTGDNTLEQTRTRSEATGRASWTSSCRALATPSDSATSGASPTYATATEAVLSSYRTSLCCRSSECRCSSWNCRSDSSAAMGHLHAGDFLRYSKVTYIILTVCVSLCNTYSSPRS